MPVQTRPIDRKQAHETTDVRPLLKGQRPVHVSLAGIQFGVKGELYLKSTIMQPQRDRRTRRLVPETVQRPAAVEHPECSRLDEVRQQVRQQPHFWWRSSK